MTTLDGAVDLARDRELVERCQQGDERAFAELYQRYQRRLHRFCVRRLHASDDAEEAVQEAFARAWRALPRFAGERRFYPWLTVIAGNVCTDMLRRRSRTVPMGEVPARDLEVGVPEIDEQLLRQVDLALASEALGNLSDRHQRVLRLREATEWSAQRIAEHEGLAAPAVDTLLWRARQAFKREFAALSETGGGLAAVLGIGVAGLRRGIGRLGARLSSVLAPVLSAPRAPGVVAATVAVAGAAIAGGSVALIGQAPAHPPPRVGTTVSTQTGAPATSGASGASRSGTGTAGNASPATTHTNALASSRSTTGGSPASRWLAGLLPRTRGTAPSSPAATRTAGGTATGAASSTVGGAVAGTVGGAAGAVVTAATSTLTTATSVVRTVLGTTTGTTSTASATSGTTGTTSTASATSGTTGTTSTASATSGTTGTTAPTGTTGSATTGTTGTTGSTSTASGGFLTLRALLGG